MILYRIYYSLWLLSSLLEKENTENALHSSMQVFNNQSSPFVPQCFLLICWWKAFSLHCISASKCYYIMRHRIQLIHFRVECLSLHPMCMCACVYTNCNQAATIEQFVTLVFNHVTSLRNLNYCFFGSNQVNNVGWVRCKYKCVFTEISHKFNR